MALSEGRARSHVDTWCGQLGRFATRANWPRYVFHAAQVTKAVEILRSGFLQSRQSQGAIEHDVANQMALGNNTYAHPYARMYFRPRNHFHLRTEGIKHQTDQYWMPYQMSIPILLAFDAISVLTTPGVEFSRGNLSKTNIEVGSDEAFFETIPFEFVYHDEAPRDPNLMATIHYHRMAEIIVPGQLSVAGGLRRVICRSQFDKVTLLYLLGNSRAMWQGIVAREQIPGSSFFRRELLLSQIELIDSTLYLSVKPPHNSPARRTYQIRIVQRSSVGEEIERREIELPMQYTPYAIPEFRSLEGAVWEISLEGMLAFMGEIPQGAMTVT